MKHILLIKLRYIGDVVLSTPLLPLLRRYFPEASLSFLVNPGTEAVLSGNPHLEHIMVLPREGWDKQMRFLYTLRQARFDAVVDLTDGDRSAFLTYWTGAGVRLGFNREHRWRGKLYTRVLPSAYGSMHMVDYHAQALTALGISAPVGRPELYLGPDDQEQGDHLVRSLQIGHAPLVLLHPLARYVDKAWPLERFAALADWLAEQGAVVALIGHQAEVQIGRQLINASKSKPHNLMGHTRLRQLAAVMKRSALFVGNDGGPMHMAAAVGCPVLGLFGPTDPQIWGPRGEKVSVMYKGLDCEACFYPGCTRGEESCMRQISVKEVCQVARQFLE
ncbi:MAG TPA: putative lipopolysaccharide heptosyltransferase III [Nitrospirales bacterium]|nr:putative lipopolysaccharide heptosyltransferase III [Nitrospirales bacterium]